MLKFVIVVVVIALAIYLLVRAAERGSSGQAARRPFSPKPRPPQRPLGPDDDPDFLRDLNRKNRKKRQDPTD
ncbi:hypothetical protein [Nocardioides sp.]|uniref:hypothetical protein n=1 Tax=Nocardioides sp. TaxID=35761 RepID=UPI002737187A|nr:hypothetical protein [Nocardioides sp.]MDP3890654.1 hypothetical protein [Nocardioides sp.]